MTVSFLQKRSKSFRDRFLAEKIGFKNKKMQKLLQKETGKTVSFLQYRPGQTEVAAAMIG